MGKKVFIIDAGHGKETPGKRSPLKEDGTRFYEWLSNRDIARRVMKELDALGIKYHYTVNPDDERDMSLQKRVEIANAYARGYGKDNTVFISLHSNAFGDGKSFNDASGWCIYTSKGKTKSDEYATICWNMAKSIFPKDKNIRKDMSDGDPDREANFYVLYHTICPAFLVEAWFYTNRKDLEYLESEEGKETCTKVIVEAIKEINRL